MSDLPIGETTIGRVNIIPCTNSICAITSLRSTSFSMVGRNQLGAMGPPPSRDRPRRSSRLATIQATSSIQAMIEENPVDPDPPNRPSTTESQTTEESEVTAFTATTKNAIIRICGDACWHCDGQEDLECAHVIGRAGKDVRILTATL